MTIVIFSVNHTAFAESSDIDFDGDSSEECTEIVQSYSTLNDLSTMHVVSECSRAEGFTKSNVYAFVTGQHIVGIVYSANSTAGYDQYLNDYEQSLQTFQIQNTMDIKEGLARVWNMTAHVESVSIEGASVDLAIQSSTPVDSINMEEESKSLSIQVSNPQGQNGYMSIAIDSVLEGPFMVTSNRQIIDSHSVIEDEATGGTIITIPYDSDADQFMITGTNVVPEFPAYLLGLITALVIGGIIATTRLKRLI